MSTPSSWAPIPTSREDVVLTPVEHVDPRVRACFAAQGRSHTAWLEITAPVEAYPQALIDSLAEAGWTYPEGYLPVPSPATVTVTVAETLGAPRFETRDLGYLQVEAALVGPAAGDPEWSAEQADARIKAARAALRYHGITKVPVLRRTWQDLV